MDDVLSYPDRLSEEIVRCISCIYCKFANPEILPQKGSSVSSTSSSSSSSTFSPRNLSGSWSSHHNEESTEQYDFEVCKDENRPYSTMIEILKICLDDDSFNYATTMLHKFRLFTKMTSSSKFDTSGVLRVQKSLIPASMDLIKEHVKDCSRSLPSLIDQFEFIIPCCLLIRKS